MEQKWERNFRTQMRRRREATGESQSSLAKRIAAKGLAFHQPTVQRIEDGERPVRLDEAYVIAEVLSASVEMMTMSPDDEQVDASFSKGRLDSYAIGIFQAINPHWSDHDDVVEFMQALEQSMDAAGGVASASTRWLATWAIHGLDVMRALSQLNVASARFHGEWEPDWEEGPDPFEGWPYDNLVAIVESSVWDELPVELRPKTLAKLPVSELDDLFITMEGPFAPQAVDHGIDQATS